MKMIIQTGILMMFLLIANAEDFCSTYISQYNRFRTECNLDTHNVNISTCCNLRVFQFREISSISGVYTIRKGSFDSALAFCDMNTTEGGWIVVQRNRAGSSVNFNRNFSDYERGFGDLTGDFWYGLEELQCLTQRGSWEMRIDYEHRNGTISYLHYMFFRVDTSVFNYRIVVSRFAGTGQDLLRGYNNRGFSTADRDVDGSSMNCAAEEKSGFWFTRVGSNQCGPVNINAQPPRVGVNVQFVEMKIRQLNCNI